MKKQTKMSAKRLINALICVLVMMSMLLSAVPVMADTTAITLPDLISDNALFQQGKPINIWGETAAESSVTIKLLDGENVISEGMAQSDTDGKFETELPATGAGGPYTLILTCGDATKTVSNILVGELWFMSGQSNMELKTESINTAYRNEMLKFNGDEKIRLFIRDYAWGGTTSDGTVSTDGKDEPQDDLDGEWVVLTEDNVMKFSAVGWTALKELYDSLGGCPVGGINSSASGSVMDSFRPGSKHYNLIIAPVTNVNVRGTFWYQGCADWNDGESFTTQLKELVSEWRAEWNDADMPFIYVQLAPSPMMFKSDSTSGDFTDVRYRQLEGLYTIDGTVGAVTAIDCPPAESNSEGDLLHPKNKKPVGQRLAWTAMNLVYGCEGEYLAPIYSGYVADGNTITVNFDNIYEGLKTTDDAAVRGFSVSEDGNSYVVADAVISDDGKSVILSSSTVSAPSHFRYYDETTYYNTGTELKSANLVNSAGIAALSCASVVNNPKKIVPAYTIDTVEINYAVGADGILPETVNVMTSEGVSEEKTVVWNISAVDTAYEGFTRAYGYVEGTDLIAIANINISDDDAFGIADTTPADGETGVDLINPVRLTFNAEIDKTTLTDANITVYENGIEIEKIISYNNATNTVLLDFEKGVGNKYTIEVSENISDINAVNLGQKYTMSFIASNRYYFENFENITDPTLTTVADNSGHYKITNDVKIHKGSNSTVTVESYNDSAQLKIARTAGGSMQQYIFNNPVAFTERTAFSFDMTRTALDATCQANFYINADNTTSSQFAVLWGADGRVRLNASSVDCYASKAYDAGKIHVDIVVDTEMGKGCLYVNNNYEGVLNIPGVTNWLLTKILFVSWDKTVSETEQVSYYDNIEVTRVLPNTDIEGNTAIIYPADKSACVNKNDNVYIEFGALADESRLINDNIKVLDDGNEIEYTGTYDYLNNRYYIDFTKVAGKTYTVSAKNLMDINGTSIAETKSEFTVGYYVQNFDNEMDATTTKSATDRQIKLTDSTILEPGIMGDKSVVNVGSSVESRYENDKVLKVTDGYGQFQYYLPSLSISDNTVISYDIYIDTNNNKIGDIASAYYFNNTLQLRNSFKTDNSVNMYWREGETKGTYVWDTGKWMHVDTVIIPDSETAYMYLDGELITVAKGTTKTGFTLSKIEFISWSNDPDYSIDNICIYPLKTSDAKEGIEINIFDKQIGVGINDDIVIKVGKNIDVDTIEDSIKLTTAEEEVQVDGMYDILSNEYVINSALKSNTVYTLKIDGVKTTDGNTIETKNIRFKTSAYKQDFDDEKADFLFPVGGSNYTSGTKFNNDSKNTGIYINSVGSDSGSVSIIQKEDDTDDKALKMNLYSDAMIQYLISSGITDIEDKKIVLELDMYVENLTRNLTTALYMGSTDAHSVGIGITPDGEITAGPRGLGVDAARSAKGTIKAKTWNKIKLIYNTNDISAEVYVDGIKVIDKTNFYQKILAAGKDFDKSSYTNLSRIVFTTFGGTDNTISDTYLIDNLSVSYENNYENTPVLKNANGDTVTALDGLSSTNGLKAVYNIRNNGFETGDDLMIIMAVYSNGTLIKTETETITGVSSGKFYESKELSFSEDVTLSEGDTIKLFTWINGSMQPVFVTENF